MRLSEKSLEKLRIIINGDDTPDYRKGSELVKFFNSLGFNDRYGRGFPSRHVYTDEKLSQINGTPELDQCIKKVFAVINYIDRINELDALIADFNKYLAFDKWRVIRNNDLITFKRLEKVVIEDSNSTDISAEDLFLKKIFEIDLNKLNLDNSICVIIQERLNEIEVCISNSAPLAAIFLTGSILEAILLGTATANPTMFNRATSAPKDKELKVKKFHEWTLNNYIDVASENNILKEDVKQFSYVLRNFRNYIHPYQQMMTQFSPDKHTALICFQVLKAAIYQIGEFNNK